MPLPSILASVAALMGFVALVLMAMGNRRGGSFGIYGLALLGVACLLVFAMIVTIAL